MAKSGARGSGVDRIIDYCGICVALNGRSALPIQHQMKTRAMNVQEMKESAVLSMFAIESENGSSWEQDCHVCCGETYMAPNEKTKAKIMADTARLRKGDEKTLVEWWKESIEKDT